MKAAKAEWQRQWKAAHPEPTELDSAVEEIVVNWAEDPIKAEMPLADILKADKTDGQKLALYLDSLLERGQVDKQTHRALKAKFADLLAAGDEGENENGELDTFNTEGAKRSPRNFRKRRALTKQGWL